MRAHVVGIAASPVVWSWVFDREGELAVGAGVVVCVGACGGVIVAVAFRAGGTGEELVGLVWG